MSSFRFLGGPAPAAPASRDASPNLAKRSADAAELTVPACRDSLTKRHAPGVLRTASLRPQLPHADAALMCIPTPPSASDQAPGASALSIPVPPPCPYLPVDALHAPPAPKPRAALTRQAKRFFDHGLGAATPARRLASCLTWALRSSGGHLDLSALQNALLALGERDGLDPLRTPLKDALQVIALSRRVFGEVIEPAARCAWQSALRIDLSDTQAPSDAAWARCDAIAAAAQSIRAAVPQAERAVLTRKFLAVVAQAVPPLDALSAFLNRHEAFGMSWGEFAAFTLGPRSEAWLQRAQWEYLTALADTILQLEGPHAALLQALLKLRRSDVAQVTHLLTGLCAEAEASMQKAIRLAFWTATAKLGYGVALSCRVMPIDRLDAPLRLKLVTMVGQFTDPDLALSFCRALRPALQTFLGRDGVHDLVEVVAQQAGPTQQAQQDMLRTLQTYDRVRVWATSVVRLQRAGVVTSKVMDLAAAEVLLGGQVTGEHIVFTEVGTSWHTHVDNAEALLTASKQWGLLGQRGWLDVNTANAMLVMNGQAVPWIRQATSDSHLRMALARAVGRVPPMQMRTRIDEVMQLYHALGCGPLTEMKIADKVEAIAQMGAMPTVRAFAAAFLTVPNPSHLPDADRAAALALDLACDAHPLVTNLRTFSADNDDPAADVVASLVAQYYLKHRGAVDTSTRRLRRLVQACAPWAVDAHPERHIPLLLEAELRVGEALPRFWERARAHRVHEAAVWLVMRIMVGLPADGVQARILLAAFQSDATLARLAAARSDDARKVLLARLTRAAIQRLGNAENVHNAVRIRATETAEAYLRSLDPRAPLDAQAKLMEINAYIDALQAHRPPDSVWFRVRTAQARNHLDNARYVLTGPFHPSHPGQTRDLSRSVAETPKSMDVCALVWRAIDLYEHPSGTALATANEQTLMREAMILGLAECVKDETGYRVCPVGFKQRIIGILQGDDRYPQVLVDAVNAAQLLTVVGQEFANALQERDPTPQQLATFVERARATASERFADEPQEWNKFNTDLAAWVAFEYPPQASSQPA